MPNVRAPRRRGKSPVSKSPARVKLPTHISDRVAESRPDVVRPEDPKAVLVARPDGSKPTVVIRSAPSAIEELNQLDVLDYFIARAYPEGHPVRGMFSHILKHQIDNYVPPAEDLAKLREFFFTLPLAERRRVFNGWTPARDWPSAREVRDFDASERVHQMMFVSPATRSVCSGVHVEHGFALDDAINPLHLVIGCGQSREQVIDRLQRLLDFLELHWDEAVRGDRDFATWRRNDESGYFENIDVEGQVQQ